MNPKIPKHSQADVNLHTEKSEVEMVKHSPDTNNKIPQEIEGEILDRIIREDGWCAFCKQGLATGEYFCQDCYELIRKAISLAFEEAQKQKSDDVLKLINLVYDKVPKDIQEFKFLLDKELSQKEGEKRE